MATAKKAAARKAAAKKAPAPKNAANSSGAKAAENRTGARKTGTASRAAAKKTAPLRRPSKPRFGAVFMEKQRLALLAERRRYTAHAERYEAEAEQLVNEREPGDVQFDEESGEGDSIAVERDRALQISAREREEIAEIDAALMRIQDGHVRHLHRVGKADPQGALGGHPARIDACGGQEQRSGVAAALAGPQVFANRPAAVLDRLARNFKLAISSLVILCIDQITKSMGRRCT